MLKKHLKSSALVGVVAFSLLGGCAKTNPHPADPLEGVNRKVYSFNRALDKAIIRPVSYGYYKHTPKPLQSGIHNFFSNLGTISTVINDILQFKFAYAAHDATRFLINSTIGLGGVLDPASHLGMTKHSEDFGLTLYHWGLPDSMYVVLPLLGPSTIRDAVGMAVDYEFFSVWPYIDSHEVRYGLLALNMVDMRASMLRNEQLLETVGVDEYAFLRNAYLQRRAYLGNEGRIPESSLEEADPFASADWLENGTAGDQNVTNEAG